MEKDKKAKHSEMNDSKHFQCLFCS